MQLGIYTCDVGSVTQVGWFWDAHRDPITDYLWTFEVDSPGSYDHENLRKPPYVAYS